MSSDFVVFCIADVSAPPVALARRKTTGAFYSHIPVPLPPQLVIFAEGKWETDAGDLDVTLSYKDDQIHLGYVTHSNRCICWKRDVTTDLPQSMISDKEEGVAKLLLEWNEGPPVLENMVDNVRVLEETQNTPNRPKKTKRKSSLDGVKSSTPPFNKKQKLQGEKAGTRQRTPKSEKAIKAVDSEKQKKCASKDKKALKNESSNIVDEHVGEISATTADAEKSAEKNSGKKGNSNSSVDNCTENLKTESPKVSKLQKIDKFLKNKDLVTPKSSQGKGKQKQNRKSLDSNSPTLGKKRGRKSSKAKEAEDDAENAETVISKPDGSTPEITSADDSSGEKTDQETLDNSVPTMPVPVQEPKDTDLTTLKSKTSDKESPGKHMALCKDLTFRAYDRPSKRWGHSLCFVNKNMSVLIGGQGEKQQLNKDSVWSLDAETRRWRSLSTQSEGQKPEYRMGHTATYDPMVRCIYVFGGSKNTRWFHDVHILDTDEWKWQLVKVSGKAPTRAYHSATLYRHELWIFGGVYPRPDPQPDGCSNDIHIFSPVMESWYDPIVKGEKPIPRSGHSATLLGDQLVVFGGWDAPISYQDLHVLDMSIVEWTQPEVNGSPPSPRSWHASCALSNNRVLIHGGYNGDIALDDTFIFNLATSTWSLIQVDSAPDARVGHKALCMPYRHDNEEEDEVIIFGGGDNDGAYFEDLLGLYIPFNAEIS